MSVIETDYLIVGAGTAGMAFADTLIQGSDADVVMVDRRHAPGGHWNDAYSFVRLHQPSSNYGVNSRVLGSDSIDTTGPNAGFYDRATGVEICNYYQNVLEQQLLPSGQVRFFGMCEYNGNGSGEHSFTSRLTGQTTSVRVRRKVVDGTYLEMEIPATHTPAFTVDGDTKLIPVGKLIDQANAPGGYTILGAGKTAMDACSWLLDNGVDPDLIRWIKPREAWTFDRASWQPRDLVVSTFEILSLGIEALSQAEGLTDLFRRLEACEAIARVDPTVEPTMFRGATLSKAERESLGQISRVIRSGRVLHLGADRIELDGGTIPTDRSEVHVDCTAYGVGVAPARPIFEPGRITLQSLMGGFTSFNSAMIGFVESVRDDDVEKNRLCPPIAPPSRAIDWIPTMCGGIRSFAVHAAEPDLAAWLENSRLNLTRDLADHMSDPRMQPALARWAGNIEPALKNADRLMAESVSPGDRSIRA
jgi:putative NAD(P)-binding protein